MFFTPGGTIPNSGLATTSNDVKVTPYYGTFKTSDGSAGYQPNNINGIKLTRVTDSKGNNVTVGSTSLAGSKNTAGKSMNNQSIWSDGMHYYTWVGNGSNGGYYVNLGPANSKTLKSLGDSVDFSSFNNTAVGFNYSYDKNKTATNYNLDDLRKVSSTQLSNKILEGLGGSGGSGGVSDSGYNPYSAVINNLINEIKSLKKPELPAYEDMMRDYGFNIDPQYYIDMWNNQTNEYYDNMIAEQQKQRNQIAAASDLYQNQLRDDYLESYANSANTVTNKQARAASMLSQDIQNDYNDAYNDYGMMQSIYGLEEGRKAELARNPLEAEQFLNDLRVFAQQGGVAKTNAELQAYMGNNTALGIRYGAERELQAAYANAASTKYSGLAQAAGSNYNANNELNTLYNLYTKMYNGNTNAASKAMASNIYSSSGLKYGTTPANRYATTGNV